MSESKFDIYLITNCKCYGDKLVDCSLTRDGMYQADTELSSNIFGDSVMRSFDIVNIYCSPTLRTIQTIIPFIKGCSRQNKIPVLMFDDSISDMMDNNIKHYFTMKNKPRFIDADPYKHEINIIIDIIRYVNYADYTPARKHLKLLIVALSDIIGNNINILNKILIYLDKKINSTHQENTVYGDVDVVSELCDIITQLQSFGVNEFVSDYKQLININTFNDDDIVAGYTEETAEMLVRRTKVIVEKMLTDDMYKNSVYVTHPCVIKAIRYNILENIYGTELLRHTLIKKFGSATDQSLKTKFIMDYDMGEEYASRITIDTLNNNASVHNL